MTSSKRNQGLLASAAVGIAAALVVVLGNASPLLPGLHADGVQYLEAARSIARGEPATIPIRRWDSAETPGHLSRYPPGFSAALAVPIAIGVRPDIAAVLVLAASAGISLGLVFYLAWLLAGWPGGVAGTLVLGLAPYWMRLNTAVWSESLYTALMLGTVVAVVRKPDNSRLHGLLSALCVSVRFVGLSVGMTVAVWAAMRAVTARDRLKVVSEAIGPSLAFLVFWTVFVRAHDGAVRQLNFYDDIGGWVSGLPTALSGWMMPMMKSPEREWLTLIAICILFVTFLRSAVWDSEFGRTFAAIACGVSGFHLLTVIGSRAFADPLIPLDERMVLPLFVVGAVGVGGVFGTSFRTTSLTLARATCLCALAVWSIWNVLLIQHGVQTVQRAGQFYTSITWQSSPILSWAREHAVGTQYSNEPELLYLYTGRPAVGLPTEDESLASFASEYAKRPGPILLINPPRRTDIRQDALTRAISLSPLLASPHGVVLVPLSAK